MEENGGEGEWRDTGASSGICGERDCGNCGGEGGGLGGGKSGCVGGYNDGGVGDGNGGVVGNGVQLHQSKAGLQATSCESSKLYALPRFSFLRPYLLSFSSKILFFVSRFCAFIPFVVFSSPCPSSFQPFSVPTHTSKNFHDMNFYEMRYS